MENQLNLADSAGNKLRPGAELSIIVPTFNEIGNVAELVRRVESVMADTRWEMIFVDDNSSDGTAAAVREMGKSDARVRVVHRIGRRGLSSACVEGFLASSAPYLAVIDADLQHDERILPHMLAAVKEEGNDLAVGSRYIEGGSFGSWEESRVAKSELATKLSNFVTKSDLSDPMSGFFLMTRLFFEAAQPHLSSIGFKILLDLFVSSPTPAKFKEIAYEFRERHAGESKLDSTVMWEFFMLLVDKTIGRYVPVRFVSFGLVGGVGVGVHLLILALVLEMFGTSFWIGQSIATVAAMTANFFLNNILTYRDRRLKGVFGILRGWLTFCVACSVGALANVGVAGWLYESDQYWLISALAGILVGTLWNYAITSLYTWKK